MITAIAKGDLEMFRGPFLESPKTFRVTKFSLSSKRRCSVSRNFAVILLFYSLYNRQKHQLYRISVVGVLRMAFRARKVFGSFEKRTPGLNKIQTLTSAIPIQWSTSWATSPTGEWLLCEFMITRWRWRIFVKVTYRFRGIQHSAPPVELSGQLEADHSVSSW